MTRKSIHILFWTIALLIPTVAAGKTDNRNFRIISAADGLADNSTQTIDCTFSGRMVVSSLGRINIYDGGYFVQMADYNEESYPLPKYTGNYHLYFL